MQQDPNDFFRRKKPWSEYKDAILDYYLEPYLPKVATLRLPIAVIDCFAGPGRFSEDGSLGSPLIIAKHLEKAHARGTKVRAVFIEAEKSLFERLRANVKNFPFAIDVLEGDFRTHADHIRQISQDHSVFIYLDPMSPGQLKFDDLKAAYDQLLVGRSVETLINFHSSKFVRRARGLLTRASEGGVLNPAHHEVVACDEIAGGSYWQDIIADGKRTGGDCAEAIAAGYVDKLRSWFRWVLDYPIRQTINQRVPKYHLIFGSRSHHGIDLMNRAMVNARRKFVRAESVEGFLFANEPKEEVVDKGKILTAVLDTASLIGPTKWKFLRTETTVRNASRFTDSEFNQAIKKAICSGKLGADCSGTKIENSAKLWPIAEGS